MKYTISNDKKTLTIKTQFGERALLRKLDEIQSDKAMIEFFEHLTCNSELEWIDAADTGDLTDAPMLGTTDESGKVLSRWALMDYQVRGPLEDLRDTGKAVFIGGDLSPQPIKEHFPHDVCPKCRTTL
jgi:hypothetical protein